jgi:hypothetical protein
VKIYVDDCTVELYRMIVHEVKNPENIIYALMIASACVNKMSARVSLHNSLHEIWTMIFSERRFWGKQTEQTFCICYDQLRRFWVDLQTLWRNTMRCYWVNLTYSITTLTFCVEFKEFGNFVSSIKHPRFVQVHASQNHIA